MATIGQKSTSPDAGWRRYDDTDSRILYTGNWTAVSGNSAYYNSTRHQQANTSIGIVNFKFYGTQLRIISSTYSTYSDSIQITIDGNIIEYFSETNPSSGDQILVYEKTGLSLGVHTIQMQQNTHGGYSSDFIIDAIDMDATGYLVHPILNQVSSLDNMQIGDCIPCQCISYGTSSPGGFYNLGSNLTNEIPVAGTGTPNGLFYFIKVANGLLISDRVVRYSSAWTTFNTVGFIEGSILRTDNVALNKTVTVSSIYSDSLGSFVPSSLTNGSIGTDDSVYAQYWSPANTDKTPWVKIDLSTITNIKYVRVFQVKQTYSPFTIAVSNDDSSYVDVVTAAGLTNPNSGWSEVVLPDGISARYVKLYKYTTINSYGYNNACYKEIQICSPNSQQYLVRSLSGGVTFADVNGAKASTDQGKGGWPVNNEWDNYIVKSTLNNKITAGDDKVWHWSNFYTVCKDVSTSSNANIMLRGKTTNNTVLSASGTTAIGAGGFRPVMEYIDSNSKATSLYN